MPRVPASQRPDVTPADRLQVVLGSWQDERNSQYEVLLESPTSCTVKTTRPDGSRIVTQGLVRVGEPRTQYADWILWGKGLKPKWKLDNATASETRLVWESFSGQRPFYWRRVGEDVHPGAPTKSSSSSSSRAVVKTAEDSIPRSTEEVEAFIKANERFLHREAEDILRKMSSAEQKQVIAGGPMSSGSRDAAAIIRARARKANELGPDTKGVTKQAWSSPTSVADPVGSDPRLGSQSQVSTPSKPPESEGSKPTRWGKIDSPAAWKAKWVCSACSFENLPSRTVCEMCDARQDGQDTPIETTETLKSEDMCAEDTSKKSVLPVEPKGNVRIALSKDSDLCVSHAVIMKKNGRGKTPAFTQSLPQETTQEITNPRVESVPEETVVDEESVPDDWEQLESSEHATSKVTTRDLYLGEPKQSESVATASPPKKESWSSMVARRKQELVTPKQKIMQLGEREPEAHSFETCHSGTCNIADKTLSEANDKSKSAQDDPTMDLPVELCSNSPEQQCIAQCYTQNASSQHPSCSSAWVLQNGSGWQVVQQTTVWNVPNGQCMPWFPQAQAYPGSHMQFPYGYPPMFGGMANLANYEDKQPLCNVEIVEGKADETIAAFPQCHHDTYELTAVLLRKIPTSYTRDMVLALLNSQGFLGRYDFVYLPLDGRTGLALGFAIVNAFTNEDAILLNQKLTGFTDWQADSTAPCEVVWADYQQGQRNCVERYRNSPVMHPSIPDEYKPAIFSLEGKRVPFPAPTMPIEPIQVKVLEGMTFNSPPVSSPASQSPGAASQTAAVNKKVAGFKLPNARCTKDGSPMIEEVQQGQLQPDQKVEVVGLKGWQELNGKTGTLRGQKHGTERWYVLLDEPGIVDGNTVSVAPENLAIKVSDSTDANEDTPQSPSELAPTIEDVGSCSDKNEDMLASPNQDSTTEGTCSSGPSSRVSTETRQELASPITAASIIPPPPSEPPLCPWVAPPTQPPPTPTELSRSDSASSSASPASATSGPSQCSTTDGADSPRYSQQMEQVEKLCNITGLSADEASELLSSHNWDLPKALATHIEGEKGRKTEKEKTREQRKVESKDLHKPLLPPAPKAAPPEPPPEQVGPPPPPPPRRSPLISGQDSKVEPEDIDEVPPPPPPRRSPAGKTDSSECTQVDSAFPVTDSVEKAKVAVGDPVCAYFFGEWFEAKLRTLLSDDELEVEWDDGSVTVLSRCEIALVGRGRTSVNDAVVAKFWGQWHPGTVRRQLSQDWLEIRWEDGSVSDTPPEHVYRRMRQPHT